MGRRHHTQWPVAPEKTARAWPIPFLKKGVTPKKLAIDSTVANTGLFLLFTSFLAWTNKDRNHRLPSNLPWWWLPAHGAATAMPPPTTPTQAWHWYTQHPGWQRLCTSTGHPGGWMRWSWYHITDGEKIHREAYLHKHMGYDVICSTARPYNAGGAQGGVGFGVTRPSQWVEDRVHAIPRAKRGELQDHGLRGWRGNRWRTGSGNISQWWQKYNHRWRATPFMRYVSRRSGGWGRVGGWDGGIKTWYMNLSSRKRIYFNVT